MKMTHFQILSVSKFFRMGEETCTSVITLLRNLLEWLKSIKFLLNWVLLMQNHPQIPKWKHTECECSCAFKYFENTKM